jgi:hypothetical protein
MNKLIRWLKSHQLVFCAQCGRMRWQKDARYEMHHTGAIVALCQRCHTKLFHPFSEAK